MKKIISALAVTSLLLIIAVVPSFAELSPSQVLMQARAGWMKAMSQNLQSKDLKSVAKNALELSAQTTKIAKNLQGERHELTLKVSTLAKEAADAAVKNNLAEVQAKFVEIKETCTKCHDKYRK